MLDEGVIPAFLTLENGGMCMLGISQSCKGKCCLEIKAWDLMSSLGFTAKEITVQDLQRNTTNDGKFKYVFPFPISTDNFLVYRQFHNEFIFKFCNHQTKLFQQSVICINNKE